MLATSKYKWKPYTSFKLHSTDSNYNNRAVIFLLQLEWMHLDSKTLMISVSLHLHNLVVCLVYLIHVFRGNIFKMKWQIMSPVRWHDEVDWNSCYHCYQFHLFCCMATQKRSKVSFQYFESLIGRVDQHCKRFPYDLVIWFWLGTERYNFIIH